MRTFFKNVHGPVGVSLESHACIGHVRHALCDTGNEQTLKNMEGEALRLRVISTHQSVELVLGFRVAGVERSEESQHHIESAICNDAKPLLY